MCDEILSGSLAEEKSPVIAMDEKLKLNSKAPNSLNQLKNTIGREPTLEEQKILDNMDGKDLKRKFWFDISGCR